MSLLDSMSSLLEVNRAESLEIGVSGVQEGVFLSKLMSLAKTHYIPLP